MTSLKKITLAIPAMLLSVMAFAQPADPNYDPKAKAILDEVSKTAKAYTSITATFSITVKQANNTTDVKNGSVIMKSGKYKIILENKVKEAIKKEEYYNDGKTTWVYIEKDKEVTIDNAPDPTKKKADNSISPNDIFTIHEKGFKYTFVKEETQNGRAVQLINLIPEKPEKKNYHTVKLTIDKVKKQIINVVFMNKDGSSITYNVKTFTPNTEVSDSVFQFDLKAHPGVTVINMKED
ncbi:MAG: outer membrane lipoprotein carrier protein LolA [Bacteroidota bacterium]|nr:outer membrane lipoprotein carrier protein LolA [Bacteroidota bacterium]